MQFCVWKNFLHFPPKPLRLISLLGQLHEIHLPFETLEERGVFNEVLGGGILWTGTFALAAYHPFASAHSLLARLCGLSVLLDDANLKNLAAVVLGSERHC